MTSPSRLLSVVPPEVIAADSEVAVKVTPVLSFNVLLWSLTSAAAHVISRVVIFAS